MKKICVVLGVVFTSACGNSNFSYETNPVKSVDKGQVTSGLVLTVKNSLPEQQVNSTRIKPDLNAFFCSPLISEEKEKSQSISERCVRLKGVILNGTEEVFVVSSQDVKVVYKRGNGQAAFEFMDANQGTSLPWHCYSPNDKVTLDSNTASKQSWHVEVNQRYTYSYGCLIEKK